MKQVNLSGTAAFRVLLSNQGSQAAEMVLAPKKTEGGPDNRHLGSDQWLYVVSGRGTATIRGKRHSLKPGMLILIERGETHEIRSSSKSRLQTVNFYVPPAYDKNGEPLPHGQSEK